METTKKIVLLNSLLLALLLPCLAVSQGIEITPGSSITITGNASIEISNGNLINNGKYLKGTENLVFSGKTSGTLKGNNNLETNNLLITNTGGITTQLGLLTTNNLTLGNGSKFTVDPAKALTVNGALVNNSGSAAGLLLRSTEEGTASLLHKTDFVQATIQRYITGSNSPNKVLYHMVSVPLVTSTNSTTEMFHYSNMYDFIENANSWHALGSTPASLDESRGYLIIYPVSPNTTYAFSGFINNGSITPFTALTSYSPGKGYNLVPNPFPSAIDWNSAEGWTKKNIDGSIYFWPAGKSADEGNYASWNGTIGTGGQNPGSQYIPIGQSFFVHANGDSPQLKMDNNVRVHNSQAFSKNATTVSNFLRLMVSANNSFDDLVVQFRPDATIAFDNKIDAYKIPGGTNAPQFSSIDSDGNLLSINNLPFSKSDIIVPLNFSLNSASNVIFTASGMESFNATTTIFLNDLTLKKSIDLRKNPVYTFQYSSGSDANRFQLKFSVITNVPEISNIAQGTAFISNNTLSVSIPEMDGQACNIALYNILGQQLSQFHQVLNGWSKIQLPQFVKGIYIVQVRCGNKLFTAKIPN